MNRREFLQTGLGCAVAAASGEVNSIADPVARGGESGIPVIDITDLYHPPQDPGDNFDLIAAYALPEIDLKAVVLDVTGIFRQPVADVSRLHFQDRDGPREAGIIPVTQLNSIFERNIPYGIGPYSELTSPEDRAMDTPPFQQTGIDLLLKTLRNSHRKVEIVSFGSARVLAMAYNREPELLKSKVERIHLSAGASSPDYLEWNVMLDTHAFVRLLRSELNIALYPCATHDGPAALGANNTYWKLKNLHFIGEMDPQLRRYLLFAFERSQRADFLRALEIDFPHDALQRVSLREHNVWETAIWMQVANRKLVKRTDGSYSLVPAHLVAKTDRILPNDLKPCSISVRDDGMFTFTKTGKRSNIAVYERGNPEENEKALREALPELYKGFDPAKTRRQISE